MRLWKYESTERIRKKERVRILKYRSMKVLERIIVEERDNLVMKMIVWEKEEKYETICVKV